MSDADDDLIIARVTYIVMSSVALKEKTKAKNKLRFWFSDI